MLHSSQAKGGSVHVWGAFWFGGRSSLSILTQNVNGLRYRELIRTFLSSDHQLPQGWMLQQDNATAHTSRIVTDTIKELGIRVLPWPAKSPDLNPIEHVWDAMGRAVAARSPQNLQQLQDFLVEEWNKLSQEYLNKLVMSMPDRVAAVIRAKGRNTRY